MSKYTITRNGTNHPTSAAVFYMWVIPILITYGLLLSWGCWLLYFCATMLATYSSVPAFVCGILILVLLGSFKDKALLPSPVRKGLALCLAWGTVYYSYAVEQWEPEYLLMLIAPLLYLMVIRVHTLMKK